MAVVLFSSVAERLFVRFWLKGVGYATYTCWLRPVGTDPDPLFARAASGEPQGITLPGPPMSYDGRTLRLSISYSAEEVGTKLKLYFDIYDNIHKDRIGGLESEAGPFIEVEVKGSEDEDYRDRRFTMRVQP